MKKMYLILGLALGMLTVACSQDVTEDIMPTPQGEVTLGVALEEVSRTQLGAFDGKEYPILWSEGDKILVNGVESNALTAAQAGGKLASFTVSGVTAPYQAFYPADIAVKTISAKNYHISAVYIPAVQEYAKNSFANKTAVMYAFSQNGKLTMHHLYGFVKVAIAKGDDVALKSVTLQTLGGEPVAGEFAIAPVMEKEGWDWISGIDYIHVSAADGIPYEGSKAEVIIAVPAGTYSKGFSITIEDAAGKAMTKTAYSTTGVEIKGGVILSMPEVTYVGAEQKGIVIRTAEQLNAFAVAVNALDYSAYVNADGEVVLGGDIDLTGVTLTPIETFDGVFNGKGYSLKNWTTTRGLFGLNTGTVKNVVVDKSCVFNYNVTETGIQHCAFIVEDNEEAGIVDSCINHGDVNVTDISAVGTRIGAIVGTSYGTMKSCVNYGDVTVTSPAVNNNQNIGGVVGYLNPNAGSKVALGTAFVENCSNYGDVNVLFACLPKKVCVGGVAGGTQMSKSTAATHLGTIRDCCNYGKVSYRFETLSSGTYANVGGVIGYSQADIIDCCNFGRIEFSTPIADLNQGGTRPAAGGVVGSTLYNLIGCENMGELFVEGVWAAGTQDADGAGSQAGAVFGGVAGCVGIYNVYNTDYKIEDCGNYGTLNIYNNCKVDGGTKGWHAGVVGYATWDVYNCYNYGTVNIKHNTYENYSSGIIGETKGGVYNCECAGPVNIDVIGVSKAGGALYNAGIAGYVTTKIEGCTLSAPLTVKVNGAAGSLRFAGIVGQIKTASTRLATISNCKVTKDAKLSFTTNNKKANYTGAVVALANNGVDNCSNEADFDITVTEALVTNDIFYIAGVAGAQQEDMTNCTNSGNIYADMCQSTVPLHAGLLLGDNKKAGATISNCSNSGTLTIVNAGNTEFIDILVGHKTEESSIDEASITNTGKVIVNGEELKATVALSIDGKQWVLPSDIAEMFSGVPTARLIVDLGVSFPGQLIVGADYESIYGAAAAGMWAPLTGTMPYTIEVVDATSGNLVLSQTNMYDEVTTTKIPYSNLTEDSVTVDFTNLLGMPGNGPCKLFTGTANLANGGGIM